MTREIEYNDAMTNMLELIRGVGFMTPGGAGSIANMLDGQLIQDVPHEQLPDDIPPAMGMQLQAQGQDDQSIRLVATKN